MAREKDVDTRQESPLEYSPTYKKALIEQLLGKALDGPRLPYYTEPSTPQPYDPRMPRVPHRNTGPMVMPGYDPAQVGPGALPRGDN